TRFSRDWSSDVCSSDLLELTQKGVSHAVEGEVRGAADIKKPMLAKALKLGVNMIKEKEWPLLAQPKIDGIRVIFYKQDGKILAKIGRASCRKECTSKWR